MIKKGQLDCPKAQASSAGSQIVLTNEPCFLKGSKAGERTLFSRSSDGATVFGCYMVSDPYVVAVYRDGTAFTYEPAWLTVVPNDDAKAAPVKGL